MASRAPCGQTEVRNFTERERKKCVRVAVAGQAHGGFVGTRDFLSHFVAEAFGHGLQIYRPATSLRRKSRAGTIGIGCTTEPALACATIPAREGTPLGRTLGLNIQSRILNGTLIGTFGPLYNCFASVALWGYLRERGTPGQLKPPQCFHDLAASGQPRIP